MIGLFYAPMNTRFSLFISVLFAVAISYAQPSYKDLTHLLNDELLSYSDASLVVYDLTSDSLLFSHRAHKLSRPASVLKIITSVVALERLGCNYTVDTYLLKKGGSLYFKGEIDPLFSYDDLCLMLQSVPAGFVADTVYADCSFMDSVYWGPGWAWDDTPWEFQPYISPLMLCGGCVQVTAKPAESGKAPYVECYPPSSFYSVVNEAVSRGGTGEKFTILRDWLCGTNVIRLRGDCSKAKSEKMNVYPSQDYFIAVAAEQLAARGVAVRAVDTGVAPQGCDTLAVVRRSVNDIVAEALMESDNLCAEALAYHLGSLYGRFPVKQSMGPDIIKGFLDYTLDMPLSYDVCDGSGLSPYTLVSADMIMQVLRYAYSRKDLYDMILCALPQSGISGTLKHRAKGTAAYKRVFAKTGTVTGVCTLAGYAQASNGHDLAFVILNEGSPKARPVRVWQDKVCEVLCR